MPLMKIGFVVNDIATEHAAYTTTRLAITAKRMGHEAWIMGVGEFAYDPDESLRAMAHAAPSKKFKNNENFLEELRGKNAKTERITIEELDVLFLRNDPAEDLQDRTWAQSAGIVFGELAKSRGVLVLNDPSTLADAINKMYFQHFPEVVRPRTLITRSPDDIHRFVKDNGNVVLKPLQGSGGQSVFLVRSEDSANLNQMIEAIGRDGYIIAQEYLPAAGEGDIRLFMMNGKPLMRDRKYAAFRRVNKSGDMRSNMHVGGQTEKCEITDEILQLAEIVRPKLVQDGMFLVGLDIVGDKLMEINVFSPGGLGSAQSLENVDFTEIVIEAIARKVRYKQHYPAHLDNLTLATL
jgi:glutathione synthase